MMVSGNTDIVNQNAQRKKVREKNRKEKYCLTVTYRIKYIFLIIKEKYMESINYTTFRKDLAKIIDRVNDDHCPILITRQKGRTAVLLSLDDFKSYEETAYLMKSPKNAERLNAAIAELEAGNGIERELIEE